MRQAIVWALVVWAMPGLASAEGVPTAAAAQSMADDDLDLGRAMAPPASAGLDLRIDPTQLPRSSAPLAGQPAIRAKPAERYTGVDPDPSDRGLSFGLELKPRRSTDGLARNAEPDQPGLQDDVERLIEHSTLGLRGTYRF
jgi:hypothetical protein